MDFSHIMVDMGRLGLAALLGSLIGLEREVHGRSAGLRTQLLVALGAALAMLVSLEFANVYGDELGSIRVDPARVAYGVMTGIGFLGAGAIISYGIGVRGLTTAASLWCTAAIGLACGFGMYGIAVLGSALVLFALYALSFVERMVPHRQTKRIIIDLPIAGDANIDKVRQLLHDRDVRIINVDYTRFVDEGMETITFYVAIPPRTQSESILSMTDELPEMKRLAIL